MKWTARTTKMNTKTLSENNAGHKRLENNTGTPATECHKHYAALNKTMWLWEQKIPRNLSFCRLFDLENKKKWPWKLYTQQKVMQSLRQNLKTTHKVELEANHYAKNLTLNTKWITLKIYTETIQTVKAGDNDLENKDLSGPIVDAVS